MNNNENNQLFSIPWYLLQRLLLAEDKLDALEAAGVDNWQGDGEAEWGDKDDFTQESVIAAYSGSIRRLEG